MDSPMISVIIPVYNGEAFVERAINSILNQTSDEIELIVVDDGSTDRSGEIVDLYAEKYKHIHVVHKVNGGLSSARNAGIHVAKGEYLLFLDADDYIDKEACAEMIKVIRSVKPDCIDFGWRYLSESGDTRENRHGVEKNRLLNKKEIREIILPPLLNLRKDDEHFIYDFSCTKLFRKEIIEKHQIHFDETRRVWEDRPFVLWYLKYCDSFYSMEQCFYNYVDVPGSLSRRYSLQFFDIILDNYKLYNNWYGNEFDFDTPYANAYWASAIENMIYRSLEEKDNQDEIREIIKRTLQDETVLKWYRTRTDVFAKKIIQLMEKGKYDQVITQYDWMRAAKTRCLSLQHLFMCIKRILRRALER